MTYWLFCPVCARDSASCTKQITDLGVRSLDDAMTKEELLKAWLEEHSSHVGPVGLIALPFQPGEVVV